MSNRDKASMHKKNRTKDVLINRLYKGNTGNRKRKHIYQRQSEYIRKLIHDEKEKPRVQKNIEGPKILKSEIRSALNKINRNKAIGPGGIIIKMLTSLDNFGIDKITE